MGDDGAASVRADFRPSFPFPVIPAKAGIQMVEAKFAIRNQVRIASDKSLWERGRPARNAALARVTLILTFSHQWRRDPLTALGA